jgi:hypothetical protein
MAEAVQTSSTPSASSGARLFGHITAVLLGVLSIIAGFTALTKPLPATLGVTLLVLGVLLPVLAWKSLQHSRTAWSFLISTVAVLATVMFFGAPKIAHVLGINLVASLAFPAVQIACVIALAGLRREYRN